MMDNIDNLIDIFLNQRNILYNEKNDLKKLQIGLDFINSDMFIKCVSKTGSIKILKCDILYEIGQIYARLKKYKEAVSFFDLSIKMCKNKYKIFQSRATARIILDDYIGAILDYDRAIELNKMCCDCWYNRGCIKAKLNRPNEAIYDFDRALKLNKNYINAYFTRANAKLELEIWTDALKDYKQFIDLGGVETLQIYEKMALADLKIFGNKWFEYMAKTDEKNNPT
jgi:tetratricopeptide (TPR) repeat protein